MGRITVFVSNECTDCQLVRNSFQKYAIPFEEINVDADPRKRRVMIQLTDRLTTPQVFFNKKHIGGVTALTTLLTQYDQDAQITPFPSVLECITGDVLDQVLSPEETHLMFHNTTTVERCTDLYDTDQLDRIRLHDIVQIKEGVQSTIGKITRDLLKWLPRQNRRNANRPFVFKSYHCQSSPTYNDYFNGSEAIKTFRKYYNLLSPSAVKFGQTLVDLGIIHRLETHRLASTLFCAKGYFRLQPYQSPEILNTFRIWTRETALDQLSPDPILTLSRLLRQMTEILTSATNDAGIVDYYAARTNGRFQYFEEAVCQLQLVELTDIIDEHTKKTFFINVYNLMAKHAFVKLCPRKVKRGMFDTVHYNLGGFIFSLDDIYHGILRTNKHPKRQGKMFSVSDPRASFSLRDEDARIHFALSNANNANHTTLYEYHVDAIDEELRIVAEFYCTCNKRLYISGVQNKVILPKFMETYRSDFTTNGDTHSLLQAIMKYVARNKRRFLELTEMLEKFRISEEEERLTVLFHNDLVPSRRNHRRRKPITFRKLISWVRLFKRDAKSMSKYYSTIHELATVKCLDSPVRSIDLEQCPKRRLSDLTWDCTPELPSARVEAKGELECPNKDQGSLQEPLTTPQLSSLRDSSNVDYTRGIGSTTDTPSYQVNIHNTTLGHQPQISTRQNPDYSVSDESSSYISFDIGSKSFAFSHEDGGSTNKIVWNKTPNHASEAKTNPEYLPHKFPCELTISDGPNNYSLRTQSTIDLTSSRIDSDTTDIENFDITNENKVVGCFDTLYSNAKNESTVKASAYTFSNHVHKYSIKPDHEACALSYPPDEVSTGTKATTSPFTLMNGTIKPGLDAESSGIPRINEVNVGQVVGNFDPLYSNRNNTSTIKKSGCCKVPNYVHKPNIEPEHDECTLSYLPDEYSLETKSATNSPTSTKRSIKSGLDSKNSDIPSMNEIDAEMSTMFDSLFVL